MAKLNKAQFFLGYMLFCDHDGQNCDGWDRATAWRRYEEEDYEHEKLAEMIAACEEEGIDLKELA